MNEIADASGVPVERPKTGDAACLGAAALAMVGARRFGSVMEAAGKLYHTERRFQPNPQVRGEYERAHRRYRRLYESLYGQRGTANGET